MAKKIDPDWTPALDGATYCSPACGHKCTKAAFDAQTRRATLLAKRLGNGWRARVWENMGWHASVVSNSDSFHLKVYLPSVSTTPRVALGAALSGRDVPARSRDSYWIDLHVCERQFHCHDTNVRRGIKRVVAQVRGVTNAFEQGMAALSKELS